MWSPRLPVDQKKNHITSLFALNLNAKEVEKDSRYEVTTGGFLLSITLSPDFPEKPPIISISPPTRHAWVSSSMCITGHDKIKNWDGNYLLGQIIKDITLEFQINPPGFMTNKSTVKDDFLELNTLKVSEIQDLLDDEEKLVAFFHGCTCVKNRQQSINDLKSSNINLCKKNLDLEAEIMTLRKEIGEMQKTFEDLQERIKPLTSMSDANIMAKLKTTFNEAETKSDEISRGFLQGSMGHENFLSEFYKERLTYHQAAIRLENWKTLK
ncbi:hypothetical protein ROZALSC1DRAFT_27914 [Rozella allomycis CSF55]|uniref:VPS37 C-terminal domain-containing protein n=1 Tax=Rozella allomycis (strain CSF55) TaxID=988480 RepID=A0A075B0S8_ROZAC|nr:hypothetical protein O9G_000623 [Rozella allomycis CSF55]RKP20620.1 hypothetical protein ROZALSC1DRAFT_27914 [Rozella allomycis CSF55]|eukprot:EPZ34436.1 hypothetical protein O9G_000623 [Rozella allomycis CSF55]